LKGRTRGEENAREGNEEIRGGERKEFPAAAGKRKKDSGRETGGIFKKKRWKLYYRGEGVPACSERACQGERKSRLEKEKLAVGPQGAGEGGQTGPKRKGGRNAVGVRRGGHLSEKKKRGGMKRKGTRKRQNKDF